MVEGTSKRLTAAEAKAKAVECLALAQRAGKPEHRAMLEDMAETWEHVARALKNPGDRPGP